MKFALGSTRAGLRLKDHLKRWLVDNGHSVDDVGMQEGGDFVPYHESAAAVARAVSSGRCERGIAICGTGAGSVIVCNKFKGVYAAPVVGLFDAGKAAAVNGANVLVFGEWLTPPEHATECLKTWLSTAFGEGFSAEWTEFLRGARESIQAMEEENFR